MSLYLYKDTIGHDNYNLYLAFKQATVLIPPPISLDREILNLWAAVLF